MQPTQKSRAADWPVIFHELMKTDFTEQEKAFLKRQKEGPSKLKIIAIAIVFLLCLGILIGAFNSFYIFRNAKSISWGIGGLLIIALFYLVGEAGSGWINSKDDVSHPLYKRVFHLFVLVCVVGIVMAVCWYVFKKSGW